MKAETVHQLLLLGILVGLAFAIYAALESTIPGLQGSCHVNSYISCGKIDNSGHTTTLGIQDYNWGIGGFVVMLLLDIPLYRTWRRDWLQVVTLVSGLGAVLSIYFAYLELFVIQGLCPVCLGAYLSNVAVFACAVYLLRLGSSERRAAGGSDGVAA
jgi:uncharacterized membrane protein